MEILKGPQLEGKMCVFLNSKLLKYVGLDGAWWGKIKFRGESSEDSNSLWMY